MKVPFRFISPGGNTLKVDDEAASQTPKTFRVKDQSTSKWHGSAYFWLSEARWLTPLVN